MSEPAGKKVLFTKRCSASLVRGAGWFDFTRAWNVASASSGEMESRKGMSTNVFESSYRLYDCTAVKIGPSHQMVHARSSGDSVSDSGVDAVVAAAAASRTQKCLVVDIAPLPALHRGVYAALHDAGEAALFTSNENT